MDICRTNEKEEFLAAHRTIGWTVVLLTVPVALGAVLLLSLLVRPEPPVVQVLTAGRVGPMGEALGLGLLLAGLYAVARSVHTRESRRLARQVATAVVRTSTGRSAPAWRAGARPPRTATTPGSLRQASSRRGSTGLCGRRSSAGFRCTSSLPTSRSWPTRRPPAPSAAT